MNTEQEAVAQLRASVAPIDDQRTVRVTADMESDIINALDREITAMNISNGAISRVEALTMKAKAGTATDFERKTIEAKLTGLADNRQRMLLLIARAQEAFKEIESLIEANKAALACLPPKAVDKQQAEEEAAAAQALKLLSNTTTTTA